MCVCLEYSKENLLDVLSEYIFAHLLLQKSKKTFNCVVSPARAQPEAPADQGADPPSEWRHTEGGSPSPPPESPPPGQAVLWARSEVVAREEQPEKGAQAALPSPTVQRGTEAHDSCCQWAQTSGSGWRAESGICCHWTTRKRPGPWREARTDWSQEVCQWVTWQGPLQLQERNQKPKLKVSSLVKRHPIM